VHPPATPVRYPAELHDVDVQQVAGVLALVPALAVPPAAQQLAGEPVDLGQPRHPGAGEHRSDGGGRHPHDRGQPERPGVVLGPGGDDRRDGLRRRSARQVCGREEQSASPASPSVRQRRIHL
jgi:hypothetical protein